MELVAPNLTLREPGEADAVAVAQAVHRSLDELVPWMPWASAEYGIADARAWIRGETNDPHRYVMIDPTDDAIVGACGLNDVDEVNERANLGYWVRSDRTGRGHATTAARLLARYGLESLGFSRLEILMATGNIGSRRVAERVGARYEGVARRRLLVHGTYHDAFVYSLVTGDVIAAPGT